MEQAQRDQLRQMLLNRSMRFGEFVLSSGATSNYYIDVRKTSLHPEGLRMISRLFWEVLAEDNITAVGGLTMGADPLACGAIGSEEGDGLVAFFVRKERKEHGLQRWIEGPELAAGTRCLVVEDVVTTGGSTVRAIERIREEGLEVAGVTAVVDRLAGGAEAIEEAAGAPYRPLLTIDDLYPDRPDR